LMASNWRSHWAAAATIFCKPRGGSEVIDV
jgi:hypothetical protein